MRKADYWLTQILRDGEERYLERVIRPAIADLDATRAHLAERMPDAQSGDAEITALFQAEIERIDAVEARLRGHLRDTVNRFARRRAASSAD